MYHVCMFLLKRIIIFIIDLSSVVVCHKNIVRLIDINLTDSFAVETIAE